MKITWLLILTLIFFSSCRTSQPSDNQGNENKEDETILSKMISQYGKSLTIKTSPDEAYFLTLAKQNDNNFTFYNLTVLDSSKNNIVFKPTERIRTAEWISNDEISITTIPGIMKASAENNNYIYNIKTNIKN